MKIFYLCPTGLHLALVAAGVHLGRLPVSITPDEEDIIRFSGEYRRSGYVLGSPVFVGRDGMGNDVYTVGVAAEHIMMKKTVEDLLESVYRMNTREYLVVDTAGLANGWVKLGSFLSMRFNLAWAGEKICAYGIRKSYQDIVNSVEKEKRPLI